MASSGENNGNPNLDAYDEYSGEGDQEHVVGEGGEPVVKSAKQAPPTVNLTGEEGQGDDDEHEENPEEDDDEEDDEDEGEDEPENGKSAENGASKKRTSSGAAKDDNDENEDDADEPAPDSKKPRREYGAADTTTQEAQESVDSSYGAEDSVGSNGSEHGNRNQH